MEMSACAAVTATAKSASPTESPRSCDSQVDLGRSLSPASLHEQIQLQIQKLRDLEHLLQQQEQESPQRQHDPNPRQVPLHRTEPLQFQPVCLPPSPQQGLEVVMLMAQPHLSPLASSPEAPEPFLVFDGSAAQMQLLFNPPVAAVHPVPAAATAARPLAHHLQPQALQPHHLPKRQLEELVPRNALQRPAKHAKLQQSPSSSPPLLSSSASNRRETSTVTSSSTFVNNFLLGTKSSNDSVGPQSVLAQLPRNPQPLDTDVSTSTWAAQQLLGLRGLPPSIASASATVTRTPGKTTFTILGRPKAGSGR